MNLHVVSQGFFRGKFSFTDIAFKVFDIRVNFQNVCPKILLAPAWFAAQVTLACGFVVDGSHVTSQVLFVTESFLANMTRKGFGLFMNGLDVQSQRLLVIEYNIADVALELGSIAVDIFDVHLQACFVRRGIMLANVTCEPWETLADFLDVMATFFMLHDVTSFY